MNTSTDRESDEARAGESVSRNDRSESARAADIAFKALKERPELSIRMQIYVTFIFSFFLIFGIAIAHFISSRELEKKVRFLEIANDYLFVIEEVRRLEKNFFLYGTDLEEALENVYRAEHILIDNMNELEDVVGATTLNETLMHLRTYEQLLRNLSINRGDSEDSEYQKTVNELAVEVRRHGREIVLSAQEIMRKEEWELNEMIDTSRLVYILSIFFVFLFIAFNTYFLGRRILRPINRFLRYTERIASGDLTPIMPARRYRDEFSQLAIAINHMIEELDRRQTILIESHKLRAVGTLTAGIAHELNNPINNITLTAHMMLEDFASVSDEEKQDMIGDIIQEADRSQRIVRNLLDFARESESMMESLQVKDVVVESIRLVANQFNVKGVRVERNIAPNLSRIYGDKQQLIQVLINLLMNALDVTGKNEEVRVEVQPSDDPNFIEIRVIDFGPGIPEHLHSSIFDPFFTTKGQGRGTGLGLAVSQGIIGKHGGRIGVESQVGKGSTFIVTLPVTSFPADIVSKQ